MVLMQARDVVVCIGHQTVKDIVRFCSRVAQVQISYLDAVASDCMVCAFVVVRST